MMKDFRNFLGKNESFLRKNISPKGGRGGPAILLYLGSRLEPPSSPHDYEKESSLIGSNPIREMK